jgi:hypothetical protein
MKSTAPLGLTISIFPKADMPADETPQFPLGQPPSYDSIVVFPGYDSVVDHQGPPPEYTLDDPGTLRSRTQNSEDTTADTSSIAPSFRGSEWSEGSQATGRGSAEQSQSTPGSVQQPRDTPDPGFVQHDPLSIVTQVYGTFGGMEISGYIEGILYLYATRQHKVLELRVTSIRDPTFEAKYAQYGAQWRQVQTITFTARWEEDLTQMAEALNGNLFARLGADYPGFRAHLLAIKAKDMIEKGETLWREVSRSNSEGAAAQIERSRRTSTEGMMPNSSRAEEAEEVEDM